MPKKSNNPAQAEKLNALIATLEEDLKQKKQLAADTLAQGQEIFAQRAQRPLPDTPRNKGRPDRKPKRTEVAEAEAEEADTRVAMHPSMPDLNGKMQAYKKAIAQTEAQLESLKKQAAQLDKDTDD
jgi:seryl-tRNA synthetase